MTCFNDHSMTSEGNKSPLQLHIISSLKYQVIGSMIDPNTLHCFSEWQNSDLPLEGPHIIIFEVPQGIVVTNDQMSPIIRIFSQKLTNELECASIKYF